MFQPTVTLRIVGADEAALLTALRLEVLRSVNRLPADHAFSDAAVQAIDDYWRIGDHATVVAFDGDAAVACATLCYIRVMPTFDHPTGCRAHLMNVYTRAAYRRRGIGRAMLLRLMEEARRRGVTEITLDATEAGRPLYERLGFHANDEGMAMRL